jgi:hypothetical protein
VFGHEVSLFFLVVRAFGCVKTWDIDIDGMFSLAYAEFHIALVTVLGRFGDRMELFATDGDDVRVQRDYFVPKTKVGSRGVRVLIR